ncbi:MAG TPA: 50S ribosomal protein L24 [Geobacterales bacterium]|nr:50S ribosomal protein L24 [Geobacterales bacterium]
MSSKPSTQRRLLYKSFTTKDYSRLLKVHLDKELREKYKRRSLRVRKGDVVRVLRGAYKGYEGKVARVEPKRGYVYIEGLTRKTMRGRPVMIPIHASKLLLVKLDLSDKLRVQKLEEKIKA